MNSIRFFNNNRNMMALEDVDVCVCRLADFLERPVSLER